MHETKIIPGETIHGLYGTFYEKPLFEDFLLGNHGDHEGGKLNFMSSQSSHKDLNEKTFQSARWVGKIIIPEDARYLFDTSDEYGRVCIQLEDCNKLLDNKERENLDVIQEGERKAPHLKKGYIQY
ncbi:hypothetical protein ACT7DB_17305 [Bacillus cereus]